MKKLIVTVNAEIEVTDEEYNEIYNRSYDERQLDNPHNPVIADDWVYRRLNNSTVFSNGYFPADQWIKRNRLIWEIEE